MYIKVEKNPDGSHAFQTGGALEKGWAVVPDDMIIPDTFPYVNIEVADNVAVFMTEGEAIVPELTVNDLRYMRESECFPYINRGTLWYDRLTAAQAEELDIWYQAWLDVTITREIPKKPEWL